MKRKKTFLVFISFFLLPFLSRSQDSLNSIFTLDKCIEYAIVHNLELQQYGLLENKAEINTRNAKNQYLPTVEGSVKNNYNWGLFIDPSTNILTTQNTEIWSGGVGADWVLFNGGYNYYNIRQTAEFERAAQADYQFRKNEITLAVMAAYFQLLYFQEQLKIAQLQKNQTAEYYLLIKRNVEAGILHKREALRLETQLSLNDVSIVEAQNSVLKCNFVLRQTMGILGSNTIRIDSAITHHINEPDNFTAISFDSLCLNARCFLPEIIRARSILAAKRFGLSVSNSLHYPVFFISAGIQTKSSSLILLTQREQFRRNMSEYVTFNLKVPIFNRFQTTNTIALSRIDILIQEKEVKKISIQAEQRIQSALLDLVASYKKYGAFYKQMKMQEAQFVLDEKSFLNGVISYIDYNYSLNLLNQAKIQLAQAQYDYLYKREVLAFYQKKALQE